jgi:hypothetical protein
MLENCAIEPATGGRDVPSFRKIFPKKLNRLISMPSALVFIKVRTEEDFQADSRLIPQSLRCPDAKSQTGRAFRRQPVVIICQKGKNQPWCGDLSVHTGQFR